MYFFFNDTATTEIYTLSLHDALPIFSYADIAYPFLNTIGAGFVKGAVGADVIVDFGRRQFLKSYFCRRSEEHTSELQSRQYIVCRLLLEKKKTFLLYFFLHSP